MEKEIKELKVSTLQSNKFLVFVHVHTKKPYLPLSQVFCHQAMQETTASSNVRRLSMGRGKKRKLPGLKSDVSYTRHLPTTYNPMILTVFAITWGWILLLQTSTLNPIGFNIRRP